MARSVVYPTRCKQLSVAATVSLCANGTITARMGKGTTNVAEEWCMECPEGEIVEKPVQ